MRNLGSGDAATSCATHLRQYPAPPTDGYRAVIDADTALIQAWNLGEGEDGWSEAVMLEAERLLPALIDAGYVETQGNTWNFTPKGAERAMELARR